MGMKKKRMRRMEVVRDKRDVGWLLEKNRLLILVFFEGKMLFVLSAVLLVLVVVVLLLFMLEVLLLLLLFLLWLTLFVLFL